MKPKYIEINKHLNKFGVGWLLFFHSLKNGGSVHPNLGGLRIAKDKGTRLIKTTLCPFSNLLFERSKAGRIDLSHLKSGDFRRRKNVPIFWFFHSAFDVWKRKKYRRQTRRSSFEAFRTNCKQIMQELFSLKHEWNYGPCTKLCQRMRPPETKIKLTWKARRRFRGSRTNHRWAKRFRLGGPGTLVFFPILFE